MRDQIPGRPSDEVNVKMAYEVAAQTEAVQPGQPSLLNRLHRRRRELENELQRVSNSIEFCEKTRISSRS